MYEPCLFVVSIVVIKCKEIGVLLLKKLTGFTQILTPENWKAQRPMRTTSYVQVITTINDCAQV